jgi:hypothetical protein
VAISSISGWVPLGNLNPPAHTLPTDHQYIYLADPAHTTTPPSVPVVAPGRITIFRARSAHFHETDRTDYAIAYARCREVAGEFGHLTTLAPGLASRIGPFDQGCQTYSPAPGTTVTSCQARSISNELAEGESIGTTGGVPFVSGLDLSLWDTRVTPIEFAAPSRYPAGSDGFDYRHTVPMSDYFSEPAASAVRAKVGRHDGAVQRTAAPIGGTIAHDRPGTAQGNWFKPGAPTYPEVPHLAIVPDNVDPGTKVFSVGMSQPSLTSGTYGFVPPAAGEVNRDPGTVTPDGAIHCYETSFGKVLLLRLVDATTLELEYLPGVATCAAAAPYGFGAGKATYVR